MRINIKKKAVLGPGNDNDDKTVAIPSHPDDETETHSESHSQMKIETDLRHRETVLAKMKLVGENTKPAATSAVKAQERLDKETSLFSRATQSQVREYVQSNV